MANFVIALDQDAERRSRFIQTIRPRIAPMADLIVDERHQGNLSVVWAASPHAPISIDQNEAGLSILWGEAISPTSAERQTAADLKTAWQTLPGHPYDGFYAAFTYSPTAGLRVGGDVLGFFPLYFWPHQGGVVVASSPELLRYHPAFTAQLSLAGLVGVMLLGSLANDCPLWQAVKRLGAGNLLAVSPAGALAEHIQYRVPCFQADIDKTGYSQCSYEEQIEAFAAGVDQAIARHAPASNRQTLLLSGGLDSRTLASFLDRQGASPQTLTFGRPDDLESLCAQSVAHHLGWPHQMCNLQRQLTREDDSVQRCLNNAADLVTWGHLAGGGSGLAGLGWSQLADLDILEPRLITGIGMDRALGGSPTTNPCFETAVDYQGQWGGLPPDRARQLLALGDLGEETLTQVIAKLHDSYRHYADGDMQRAWLMRLYYGNRFPLGLTVWRMSFAAWPRLPILDQQLLSISGQLPGKTTMARRAQREIIRRCFPAVARLPLDHNDFNIEPLYLSPRRKRLKPLVKVQQRWWKLQKRLGRDRRYYYRNFNINRPELKALRQQADQHRAKFADIWNLSVLDELMPSQSQLNFKADPICETKRYLTLTGLLLWAGKNL